MQFSIATILSIENHLQKKLSLPLGKDASLLNFSQFFGHFKNIVIESFFDWLVCRFFSNKKTFSFQPLSVSSPNVSIPTQQKRLSNPKIGNFQHQNGRERKFSSYSNFFIDYRFLFAKDIPVFLYSRNFKTLDFH